MNDNFQFNLVIKIHYNITCVFKSKANIVLALNRHFIVGKKFAHSTNISNTLESNLHNPTMCYDLINICDDKFVT
jgi:hypothetical protein